jgi:3-isopropylmalate/(R)-2-methylmalate dehydratase small subunit
VWALNDGGFRVVISSRFADIFRNNSTKAGLLTVLLPQEDVEALWARIEADPTTSVTVDLQAKQVTYTDVTVPFEIDDYTRWRLLEGLDDVGLTERNLGDIETFEANRQPWLPSALPAKSR